MSQDSTQQILFADYAPAPSAFDEVSIDGNPREHWQDLLNWLGRESRETLTERSLAAQRMMRDHGVTFNVFDDNDATERPWELDLLPYILHQSEWSELAAGLTQRATLLDLIIRDIYGPQETLKNGLLPPRIVSGHPGYIRAFQYAGAADSSWLHYAGFELARAPSGRWFVMADRTDIADGAGYALEHRLVLSRSLPMVYRRSYVRRHAPFFHAMREAFESLAPRATEFPRVVILTPGPNFPGYFEDQFLARYLGYQLVEGGDLAVRSNQVSLKTLDGLLPIDVIFRRIGESVIDPVELGGSSPLGVPGLLQAARERRVAIVNIPGCRIAETPVFMAFLPQLCRHFLNEDLKLPSIATWWCGNERGINITRERFADLVIKPAFSSSGSDESVVSELSENQQTKLLNEVMEHPERFVAQEKIVRASAPVWRNDKVSVGHIALRAFTAKMKDGYQCLPGALVRVAPDTGPMVLSMTAGEFSKDAWIVADEPPGDKTLLPGNNERVASVRATSQLPSRSAENLYWLGRQIDRTINSVRLMRFLCDALMGEDEATASQALRAILRAVASEGMLDADYAIPKLAEPLDPLERVLPAALFDRENQSSIRYTMDKVNRLASGLRDRISYDTWQIIRYQSETFRATSEIGECYESLNRLLLGMSGCVGIMYDGKIRGPAWRFFDLGRRVERCHWIASVLKNSLCMLERREPAAGILNALMDVFDCRITYRTRYLASVRMAPLLDLLICDSTNPGSLASQVEAMQERIEPLNSRGNSAGRTKGEKALLTGRYQIDIADVYEFADNPATKLDAFLDEVIQHIDEFANEISRTYLIHSGELRQIFDDEPGTS